MQRLSGAICLAVTFTYVSCESPHVQHSPKSAKMLKGTRDAESRGKSSAPLLQLMGLSLDNWGSAHVEAMPLVHGFQSPKLTHREDASGNSHQSPGLLSMMSMSLDAWGRNNHTSDMDSTADSIVQDADYVGNPLAQVYPATPNLFDARGFQHHTMSFAALESMHGSRLSNMVAIICILLFLLALIVCYLCWEAGPAADDDPQSPSLDEGQQDMAAWQDLAAGSWAQVYRDARGEQKEALELLFRCNIISTDEFAFSSVSPEHIQECIWIATHMLRQKPLEEWVALWQQAQQTFEDSVTACFEARGGGGPPSSSSLPSSSNSLPPSVNLAAPPLSDRGGSRLSPAICEDDDEDDLRDTSVKEPSRPSSSQTSQTSQSAAQAYGEQKQSSNDRE